MAILRGKLDDIYARHLEGEEELSIFINIIRDDDSIIRFKLSPFESESMIEELNKIINILRKGDAKTAQEIDAKTTQEIMEYISGHRMANTQAIIALLGYIKDHMPNGDQAARLVDSFLDNYANRVQTSDVPHPVKQGFQDGANYIRQEISDSLSSPDSS